MLAASVLAVGVFTIALSWPAADPHSVVLSKLHRVTDSPVSASPFIRVSLPEHLAIPAIGVNVAIGRLGLQPDGQVMVPATTHTVGWYVHGPPPGQVGSAVILGHVDSYLGPGVFFDLKSLTAGETIVVTEANGTMLHFRVNRVVQYAKSNFPDQLVYGPHGVRSLQLVTCGGTFDHATGSYESNIVVFSTLVTGRQSA